MTNESEAWRMSTEPTPIPGLPLLRRERRLAKQRAECRGEQMANRKLSDEAVMLLRELGASHSLSALTRQLGMSKNTAWRIVRGVKWKHFL